MTERPIILTTTHPKAQCLDLRAMFAGEFKFSWDPAYAAEGRGRNVEAPWLTRIRCRYGFIFPWGGRRLAAYTTHRLVKGRLAKLPGITIAQGGKGSLDLIVTFDVAELDSVVELMQVRRPRRVTPEVAARSAERLRLWKIRRGNDARGLGTTISAGEGSTSGSEEKIVSSAQSCTSSSEGATDEPAADDPAV